jgi:hypothetical protein
MRPYRRNPSLQLVILPSATPATGGGHDPLVVLGGLIDQGSHGNGKSIAGSWRAQLPLVNSVAFGLATTMDYSRSC